MQSGLVIEALLQNQGFAVFRYLGNGRFRPIGRLPKWFLEIDGAKNQDQILELGEQFPFVQHFLVDAEELWHAESQESKHSGIWIEPGTDAREIAIEASALWLHDTPILVLRNPQQAYEDQRRWLQTARKSRLKHDRLGREIQKKEILLHCIVHDLSQPLSAMRGCFSCLTLEAAPDSIRKFVEVGLNQSLVQEAMIREILDVFSEELASRDTIRGEGFAAPDLAATALAAVKDFSATFAEKGVRIALDPTVALSLDWRVLGDGPRLRRIFGNLMENALRLSPPKSTVLLGVIDEGPFIRAFVDDEGPGLSGDPDAIPTFSLFGRGKGKVGKAGLGLYFCRMTVEQWGGSLGCEQRKDRGARFWFRLPRPGVGVPPKQSAGKILTNRDQASGDSQARTGSPAPENENQEPLLPPWRPLRILLADDTAANRELMAFMLKMRGHVVVSVHNGREVLSVLKRDSFDLLVIDQQMPELNGMETTRAIRQGESKNGKSIAIVGVTGMALGPGRDLCLAAGMNACLPKPFQVNALYETIENLFFPPGAKARDRAASTDFTTGDDNQFAHFGGNTTFVKRLVRVFLADSSKKLSAIQRAISRRNGELLASLAHSLGGSAGVFKAQGVAARSRVLESMGRNRDFTGIHTAYEALRHELNILRRSLRKLAFKRPRRTNKTMRKATNRPAVAKSKGIQRSA